MQTNGRDEAPKIGNTGSGGALDVQVGGGHYKDFPIQPIEFSTRNKLGFVQGDVVKRISRYNKPGGKGLQDLEKIIHEVQCLIEIEGWGVRVEDLSYAHEVITQEQKGAQ